MHPLLKPYNLFHSNGVAILSGFHDIPQNISVEYTVVINQVEVIGQTQGHGTTRAHSMIARRRIMIKKVKTNVIT